VRWIIGNDKDIAVDGIQVRARGDYIQRVTGAEVSAWHFIQVNGQVCKEFLCCTSNDGIDGTFITAHIGDVYKICSLREICIGKFVVANTCIWERMSHKKLLNSMMSFNRNIELWFAKQELSVDSSRIFRQSTTLNNIGRFGFQTSLSERELFMNRGKGLMEAIRVSFVRVSPVILLGD
jgi:hypothetical protein